MQALSLLQARSRCCPAPLNRRILEYVRHGTTGLLAALNVPDGAMSPSTRRKNRSHGFNKILKINKNPYRNTSTCTTCPTITPRKHRPSKQGWANILVSIGTSYYREVFDLDYPGRSVPGRSYSRFAAMLGSTLRAGTRERPPAAGKV